MPKLLKSFGLVGALAFPAQAQAPLDAVVETSGGARTHLAALWEKPTVLFYEDRDSTGLNQHVKDALFARGKDAGRLDAVAVVAVANVAAFNWFPARGFVLSAVREVEREVHVPVYLDFTGALTAAPWALPAKSSTVLVLDRSGRVTFRAEGRLNEGQLRALFAALDAALAPASMTFTP